MRITIAERLRPFCHLPGTTTLLPGSGLPVEIFPCLIRIYESGQTALLVEAGLNFIGPVEPFTVFNDLEKGRITVCGKSQEGFFRYHLYSSQDLKGAALQVDRAPARGVPISIGGENRVLASGEWLRLVDAPSPFSPFQLPACDRLSLGCHKAQDWEGIRRRKDFAEIFPVWHRLGQLVPQRPLEVQGTLSLLEECKDLIVRRQIKDVEKAWMHVFLAGFGSMMVPRLEDADHQGILGISNLTGINGSPLPLLSQGACLIRELFIQQKEGVISILPALLPCLPFGRLIDVPLLGGGTISIEWSKKCIRRVHLFSEQDQEVSFEYRSNVRTYRLRTGLQDQGERKKNLSSIVLQKNTRYLIDNFL